MEPIVSEEMSYAKDSKLDTRYKYPVLYFDEVWTQCCIHIPYLRDYYWISNYGRLYSGKLNSIINPSVESNGYCRITLMTVNGTEVRRSMHRLVMESFCWFEGCEGYQVNHIDGNKRNNWIGNLEWVTQSGNIRHAYMTGLNKSGEDSYLAKYTNETILKIANLLMQELRYEEISMIVFGEYNDVYRHLISNIANKHCWNQLLQNYEFPSYRTHKQLFSDQKLDEIYRYNLSNPSLSPTELARLFINNFDNLDRKEKDRLRRIISDLINNKAYDHVYSKYI